MTRRSVSYNRAQEHRCSAASFTYLLAVTLLIFFLSGVAQPAQARLERNTYVSYRTPHLCSYQMMEAVGCRGDKPMCCVASSAIRCCAGTASCGNCTDVVVGYEMPKSSVILGCFSLSVLVLLGSIIMSGVGRHLAWVLERRRVIENYRKRLALRRAEAREFKKELAETEEKDIEDSVACVICCARHIDVALTPCGHVCCCRFCAKRLRECPVCRAAVQRCFDLPLYYVKQLVRATAEDRDGDDEASGSAAAATATPTSDAAAAGASLDTNGTESSEALPHTREDEEAHAALHRSGCDTIDRAASTQGQAQQQQSVGEAEDGVEVEVAQTRRFHPFRERRYMRLLSDGEESDDAASSEGSGAALHVAAEAATPTTPAATAAAVRPTGYISVDK